MMDSQVERTTAAALVSAGVKKHPHLDQPWVSVAVALACAALGEGKRIASVEEVAKALGYSKQAVYDWMKAGTMKNAGYPAIKALSELSHVPIEWLTQ